MFKIPLIINSGKNTWGIIREKAEFLPISSVEEADTRLILNSRVNNEAAGINKKVVDGILLLIYALSQLEWLLPSLYRQ